MGVTSVSALYVLTAPNYKNITNTNAFHVPLTQMHTFPLTCTLSESPTAHTSPHTHAYFHTAHIALTHMHTHTGLF